MPIAARSSWQGDDSMDRFLQEQNVALYRRLRKSSTGKTERLAIFKLLAEEMDKLKVSFSKTSSASRSLPSIDHLQPHRERSSLGQRRDH
jgi:hypothetical protein